jgi:hypothetical protein
MKKKLKINFTDFWKEFIKTDNIFWNLLSKKYDLELSDNPDILFYSYFGYEFRKYKCLKVFFQGENFRPNFRECDFSFSFDYTPGNSRNLRLPLYYFYDDVNKLTLPKDPEKIASEKTKFCAFIVSNKFSAKRINFFKKLSKYKKVDSGGATCNNIGHRVDNKIEFIKQYKFTLAFENSSFPGYTTEKIFEPMLVSSVPIYWGNPLVYKDFNTKSFINYNDYKNDEEVIAKIIEIDKNPDLYYEMLKQPYFTDNKINEFVKDETILKQLDHIVESLENITPISKMVRPRPLIYVKLKDKLEYYKMKSKYYLNIY